MIQDNFKKKLTPINLKSFNSLFLFPMRLNLALPSILVVFFFFAGCNSKELVRLQNENDSLRNELTSRHNVLTSLKDVKGLLDSIDANRKSLRSDLNEGTSFEAFSKRLKDINLFVRMSEEKIELIQNALKNSKHEASAYLMLVDALKSEMQIKVGELVELQAEVAKYEEENKGLIGQIKLKEDEVKEMNARISQKEKELLLLESRIEGMVKAARLSEADAYYARARSVEEAANRTKLAPHKKRETCKEALELYKRSFSLGKQEAETDIVRLEKNLK